MGQVYNTICQRRSIRRFKQKPVSEKLLKRLVNSARLAPSTGNLQPCEFIVVNDPLLNEAVFPNLKWAGYLAPRGNPQVGEKPMAYILVLIDLHKKKKGGEVDAATAIENILLAAWEEKLGSCWIGSFDRKKIKKVFRIPHHLKLDSVIALGYAGEKPVLEDFLHSVKYWKDEQGILHVPKRRLEDICFVNGYIYSQNVSS